MNKMSFSCMGDLKAAWEQKQRREEINQARKEDISKSRQMLSGKNITLEEMFESGNNFEGADEEEKRSREEIKIEERRAAHNLKARFEKGQHFALEDEEGSEDGSRTSTLIETTKQARNGIKDSQEGSVVLRSPSLATQNTDNQRSLDGLSEGSDNLEVLGRDPNLIKCTANYEDKIVCMNTKNILKMFKNMEMENLPDKEDGEGDDSEYSDEDYSDESEDDEYESEDDEEDPKFEDELLEMEACPQSARKEIDLSAKFEKWEAEVERRNEQNKDKDGELTEECQPTLDTDENLKAIEDTKPVNSKPVAPKINRFVFNGEKCMTCNKAVYAMEKLEIHGKILHKNCFKCFKCNTRLSVGSFSFEGEHMFCTTHYKQLFFGKNFLQCHPIGQGQMTSKIEATNTKAIKSDD